MEKNDIKMMDAFVMQMLNRVTAFDMFAQAMVFVRAAAQAGGTVDMMEVGPIGGAFEENSSITEQIFENNYLTVFGDVEPWPDNDPEDGSKVTHKFTLNENGWRFAKHIDTLFEAMKDVAPTQEQLNQWNREQYEVHKKGMLERKAAENKE